MGKFLTISLKEIGICSAVVMSLVSCKNSEETSNIESKNKSFNPGKVWVDTDSVAINAHGGGILYYNNTYYWFGEHKTSGHGGNTAKVGIGCYSSKDLYNWKNEGIAMASLSDTTSEIVRGCVMERPKVIFNKKTGKFVMWFHLELKGSGYSSARTGVAVSDKIAGPYTYIRSFRPNAGQWPVNYAGKNEKQANEEQLKWWTPEWRKAIEEGLFVRRDFGKGQMSRDMTLFVDDDEKAYHIHSSEENLTMDISELNDDYTGFTGRWTRVFPGGHREAPAVFKRNGKYYMITSGCTGWDPNAADVAVAGSIWGPWKQLGNPCIGEHAELTFYSQSTYVLPVAGFDDAFIFMADRWKPKNPVDGRYIWLPVKFENEKPVIEWKDEWDLSAFNNNN